MLAIQDTTELNFPDHVQSKRGFGRSGNGRDIGLFIHPTVAVDADRGGVIGPVGAEGINLTEAQVSPHKQHPAAEKEFQRWVNADEEAGDVLAAARMVTVAADREIDLYGQFARKGWKSQSIATSNIVIQHMLDSRSRLVGKAGGHVKVNPAGIRRISQNCHPPHRWTGRNRW